MVKVERSLPAPASLAMEKEKTNGSIFDAKCDRTDTDGLPGCGNC